MAQNDTTIADAQRKTPKSLIVAFSIIAAAGALRLAIGPALPPPASHATPVAQPPKSIDGILTQEAAQEEDKKIDLGMRYLAQKLKAEAHAQCDRPLSDLSMHDIEDCQKPGMRWLLDQP